jgi:hypothetical protein
MPNPVDPTVNGVPLGVMLPPGQLTASIQKAVEQAVANSVPKGKRGALVAVVAPNGAAVGVVAALDKDGDWKLAADAKVAWDGKVSGQVVLSGSW